MSEGAKWRWLWRFVLLFLVMEKYRTKRCFQNENGASVLFILVSLPVMFTLIILTINIGQMIFDRIRLQTTVDACALAGAARQSTGLNEIADLNLSAEIEFRNAQKNLEGHSWTSDSSALKGFTDQLNGFERTIDILAEKIKWETKPPVREVLKDRKEYFEELTRVMGMLSAGLPWFDKSSFDAAYAQHKWALDSINMLRKRANGHFAWDAWRFAKEVQRRSLPDAHLFSVAKKVAGENLMTYRQENRSVRGRWWTDTCKGMDCIPVWGAGYYFPTPPRTGLDCKSGGSFSVPPLPAKEATTVRMLPTLRRPPIAMTTKDLKVRWEKRESAVTFVAYGLTQKTKGLLLGRRLFDFRKSSIYSALPSSYRRYVRRYFKTVQLPSMTAYAAAKPTGGSVYGGNHQYRPIMVQMNRVPTTVFDSRMEH